jgi:hypothetical protein
VKLRYRAFCVVVIAIVLAACAATQKPVPGAADATSASAESRAVISLLDSFQQWQSMSEENLNRELAAANSAYVREPSDAARLRLALLLSMPNSNLRNDARALALLGSVLAPASASTSVPFRPLPELALLLQTQIVGRLRAVNEELKRSEELSQKLDALRKLEQNLIEREQKARGK